MKKWKVRGEITSRREVYERTVAVMLCIVVVADLIDLVANLIFAPWQIVRSAIQTTLIAAVLCAYVVYTHSLANLKLYEMKTYLARLSNIDSLTGLLNRRAFIDIAAGAAQAAERRVLMLVDIDAFKSVNDHYGHPTGDQVIAGVAAVMTDLFAPRAPVARLGGEEFAALMSAESGDEALALAERFREHVASHVFKAGEACFSVKVSIGLTAFAPGMSFEEVYSRADKAMYMAKRQGGDRVCVFETNLLPAF